MKKVTLLFIPFIALSFSLDAQIKKGATLLGIDFAFNGSTITQETNGTEVKNTTSGFSSSVLIGKAIKDNLFVGGGVSFSTTKFKQGGTGVEQTTNGFGGSVWSRKYLQVYVPLYAFVNGSVYVNTASNKADNATAAKTNTLNLGVSIYPGISIQLKKSFYLDASLNNLANIYYTRAKIEQPDGSGGNNVQTSATYGLSTSLGNTVNPLQLGIRWIIPAKG
jgi:hypothetical protein